MDGTGDADGRSQARFVAHPHVIVGGCDGSSWICVVGVGRGATYLGKDDEETGLTTGTVSDDDELSAKFRHGDGVL